MPHHHASPQRLTTTPHHNASPQHVDSRCVGSSRMMHFAPMADTRVRASSRSNRGKRPARFEIDSCEEESILPSTTEVSRRNHERKRTSEGSRRREMPASEADVTQVANNANHVAKRRKVWFAAIQSACSHGRNPQETDEERQARRQQNRVRMVEVREAARNEVAEQVAIIHQSAQDLGPRERPSLGMLHQYEQSAVCAQYFFAEGSGYDIRQDCFNGEVASVHLNPVPFANNVDQSVNISSPTSDDSGDHASVVDHVLPEERKDWAIKDRLVAFQSVMGPNTPISACASCGIKEVGCEYKCIPVREIHCLYTESERKDRYLAAGEFQDVFHVMQSNNELYDLHQELILLATLPPFVAPLRAPLCTTCFADVSKGRRPAMNVGNIDFGRRVPQLVGLTEAEELAISRCIRFQTIIKIRSNSTPSSRGHVISFPDNAPEAIAEVLPRLDLLQHLSVSFVGTRDIFTKKTAVGSPRQRFVKVHPQISVNIERVYYALRLKKLLDPAYANISIDNSAATINSLQDLTSSLLDPDNVLFVESEEATALDSMAESNVARPETEQDASNVESNDGDVSIVVATPMDRIFVHPPVTTATSDVQTVLRATGRALFGNDEGVSTSVNVNVDEMPVNEFNAGDLYFLGGFPLLFLLGQGVEPQSAGISSKKLRHMLLQAHNQFATNAPFIFTVFNQLQRHAASRAVSLKVKGSQWSMQQFTDIVNSDGFSQRLANAIEDPTTQESKALVGVITTVARVPGGKVPWSALERKSAMHKLMAIVLYTGAFSIFGTVAPADMDSTLMLRLSCTPPNSDTGSFADVESSIALKLPGLRERNRILADNPVAAAQIYKMLVENLFDLLIGMSTSHTTRKSAPPVCERGQGILGVPIAFGGVTEEQARHSPHIHFLLVTDVSPMTIQRYCDQPEITKLLCQRLDSILRSQLPMNAVELVEPIISDDLSEPTPLHRDTRKPVDYPTANEEDVMARANAVAFAVNRHQHTLTCHKGPSGKYRCRLAMNRRLWSRDTEVLQLFATFNDNGVLVPKALRRMQDPNENVDPLRIWNDSRVLILELHRPHATAGPEAHSQCPSATCAASHPDSPCPHEYYVDIADDHSDGMGNCKVVTFSAALSSILGCNTDVEPLGTFAQAKSAIFYLVKYLTKDGHDLANILSLIKAADEHCKKYPSIADDSGTATRNSKYILTRLLNSLSGEVEVGAQIAALALVDFPSNVFSHEFFYCFVYPAINHCKSVHKQLPPTPISIESYSVTTVPDVVVNDCDVDEDIGGDGDFIEAIGCDDCENDDDAENKDITRDANDNIVFVSQAVDYKYRAPIRFLKIEDPAIVLRCSPGQCAVSVTNASHICNDSCAMDANIDDLGEYSLYEYVGIVLARPRTQSNDKARRKSDRIYEFNTRHPARKDRVQQLRSKQLIPLLAGRPSPPHPGPRTEDRSWRHAADRFASFVITLHCPWSLVTLAPPIPLTWDALETWVERLVASDCYINKARLHWLRLLAHGRTVKSDTIKLISAWRARGATYWSNSDRELADDEASGGPAGVELDLADIINDMEEEREVDFAPVHNGSKAFKHRAAVMSHLQRISKEMDRKSSHVIRQHLPSAISRLDQTTEGQVASIVARISRKTSVIESFIAFAPQGSASPSSLPGYPQQADPNRQFDDSVPSDLNEKQASAFKDIIAWANADAYYRRHLYSLPPPPLQLLISGAAGTGKTHLVRKLNERLGSNMIASVSITGVAASNLPQGATIHSTFAMPVSDRVKPSESTACTNFGDTRILIIDEISTTHADAFVWVSDILRRWFESNVSFGGLAVIAMGDFFQQGPVGRSLIQACMIDGNTAGQLFKSFRRIEFTQQQRVADDVAHSTRLDFFRNPAHSLTPVSASKILNHLKVLSVEDMLEDTAFMTAPIICSDNITRHAINKHKAKEMAKRLGQPVVAFRLPLSNYSKSAFAACSKRTGRSTESLLDEHDDLTFYFVQGAPVICKDNLSPSFGIANGTQAKLHSLTLDPSRVNVDEVWKEIDDTDSGELFYLDVLPLSVNITLNNTGDVFDPSTSLLADIQIIPMMLNTRSPRKIKVAGKNKLRQLTYFDFGIDLAFALTYFKVQGLTLDRIVLDLDTSVMPKINVAAIYVGLSRVRHGSHIRTLPISNDCRMALNQLQFRRYLVEWLAETTATQPR